MDLGQLAQAALWAVQNLSIPVREPSYTEPDFWSIPLTITRARPVEDNVLWQDFLGVPSQDLHPKVVKSYVATSFNDDVVRWRWIEGNGLLAPDSVDLNNAIERHIDRLETHPWPASFRPLNRRVGDSTQLKLQVLNTSGATQLCFAAVYGWYYPQLLSTNERSSREGVTDAIR